MILMRFALLVALASDTMAEFLRLGQIIGMLANERQQGFKQAFQTSPQLNIHFTGSNGPSEEPNIATRIELTANGTDLYCGRPGDAYQAGYAHFTNNRGEEDKHMFWTLFEARHDPLNAPTVMTLGGGPGSSGMLFPFSGAGPCTMAKNADGRGEARPSLYSWTEHVNLLSIDHPVGVDFGYGDEHIIRRTSASAAWDVDDFLQEFWRLYPLLVKNEFMINSGSYGGTFVPHIVNEIRERNQASNMDPSSRNLKMPNAIMLANTWSDVFTHFRWLLESNCSPNPDGNMFWNQTGCDIVAHNSASCMDFLQFALDNPTEENWFDAFSFCYLHVLAPPWEGVQNDPYDIRRKCPPGGCDIKGTLQVVEDVMNSNTTKDALGIPRSRHFVLLDEDGVGNKFIKSGDFVQSTYRLLVPSVKDGLRLLVYNGMDDGVVPWRSSLAWMKLMQTPHQDEFRSSHEVKYPNVGTVRKAGKGAAGDFTLVKIKEAGHSKSE